MLRAIALSLLIAAPALAAAPATPPLPAPTAPRMNVTTFDPPPSEAVCQGGVKVPIVQTAAFQPTTNPVIPPLPIIASASRPADVAADDVETLSFAIDADGRPLDIRRTGSNRFGDVTSATLAGWRFAPGAPAVGCQVSVASHRRPIDQVSRADLFKIVAFQRRNTPVQVRETLSKAGDCGAAPHRQPKTIAYPDLRRFNDRDLDPAWAGLTYDIDAGGTPRNVRVEAQGGDPALADVAAAAIAESRFQPGHAVKACYGTFAATPRDTPAPPHPDLASFKRPGDSCDVTEAALNLPPLKTYPPAYGARRVAGWAYLRFDVAPWGQIGNIEVVAAQPAAAFGDAAKSLLWNAHPAAPAQGYRGCLIPVIFKIPDPAPIED